MCNGAAELGIELSRVGKISFEFCFDRKASVFNKKGTKQFNLHILINYNCKRQYITKTYKIEPHFDKI
jgi:hypothetical protein